MVDQSNGLSPLDQIRLVESEITRQLTAARVTAEQRVVQAHMQAEQVKKEAIELGRSEGQALMKELIAHAEEEARAINAEGRRKSDELSRKGRLRMQKAVKFAASFVIGLKEQEHNP